MENPFEIILDKLNSIEEQIAKLNSRIQPESTESINSILNMEQACKFLSISSSTMYKYTSERIIPHFKSGKRIYFKTSDLVEWISQHKVKTMVEIESEAHLYLSNRRRK